MEQQPYKNYNLYTEEPTTANRYRQEYSDSLYSYINKLRHNSNSKKDAFMPPEEFAKNPEFYRNKYVQMLGYPLTDYTYKVPEGKEEFVASDDLGDIYRVSIETLPDFKFYGMIMIPKKASVDGKYPLVICQHGGGGTPELCSDIHGKNNYSHMTRRMLEYGACIFAPQLYLWNSGTYIIPQKRGEVDRELKRYGSSLFGLEIYCIRKAIDYMTSKEYIDADKIAMHGLSYGGIYTVYAMAAEPRIKAGYSCGGFNDRSEPTVLQDVCFRNSGNTFMDGEIAGLCAPRPLYIDVGKADPVFNWQTAQKEFERAVRYYDALNVLENIKLNVWDGGHTVCDNDKGHRFVMAALGHKI